MLTKSRDSPKIKGGIEVFEQICGIRSLNDIDANAWILGLEVFDHALSPWLSVWGSHQQVEGDWLL